MSAMSADALTPSTRRDFDEFEHIHLPFTGFEFLDERIRSLELGGELSLRQTRGLARCHDDGNECPMLRASQLFH